MKLFRPFCVSWLALFIGLAHWSDEASAVNIYWDGTGTGWNAAASWSTVNNAPDINPGAIIPGPNDTAFFNITSVNTPQIVNLNAAQSALGLVFNSTGTVLIQSQIGGGSANALTLGADGITHGAGAGADTISAPVNLSASQLWVNTSSGIFTTSGAVNLGANALTISGAATTTISGALSGAGSLTKNGSAALRLNASNTFTGGLTINAGPVILGNAGALNSTTPNAVSFGAGSIGALTLNGNSVTVSGLTTNAINVGSPIVENFSDTSATLTVNSASDNTYAGVLRNGAGNGSLALTKTGVGTLTLSGNADNVGLAALVSGGTVVLAKASVADSGLSGVHALGGGGLTVSGSTAIGQLGGTGGDQIWDYSSVTVTSGSFDTNGRSETIYNLALQGSGSGGIGALVNSAIGDSILTIDQSGLGVTLTGATYIGVTQSAGSLTLKGRISGTDWIQKVGAGTLILNGNSDFSGGTYLSAGTLGIGSNSALGTGPLTVSGGAIRGDGAPHTVSNAVNLFATGVVTGSADLTLAGPITGAFGLIKNGTGTLTLTGADNFTGGVSIDAGTLAVGNDTTLENVTLTFNGGAVRSDTVPRTLYNAVNLTTIGIATGSLDLTLAGPIGGSGGLVKNGSGTLTLTGANSFSGGTTIATGTLALGGGTLPGIVTNQASFVYNGGTLSGQLVNQGFATFNANFTAANDLINTGSMTAGAGISITFNASGLNNQGSLFLAGSTLNGGGPLVNNSNLSGNGTLATSGAFTNNGQLSISGGNITVSSASANANAGNIDIPSGLQLRLTGGNLANSGWIELDGGTVSGTATLNNSTGIISGHGAISSPLTNGGTLFVDAGILNVATAFANSGEVLLGGGVAALNGSGAITNTGLIRGDGAVGKVVNNNAAGEIRAENGNRLKLAAANGTNAGKINLQGGTAEFAQPLTNGSGGQIEGRGTLITRGTGLTNNGHVGFSSGITDVFGDVNNATGSGTRGITISGNADVTFWDDVTNVAGSLFKVSSGSSVTVFGTYSGAGISGNANDIHLEADISPGFSPATVGFGGNLHFSFTTTLKIELGGIAPGTEYDQVHVSEQLSLDGTLQISLINAPFAPAAGDSFDVLDWGTLSGTFSTLNLPSLSAGLMWNASQLYTAGVLNVALAGDYNLNGTVDAADYVLWRKTLGQIGTGLAADGNRSGTIDNGDYDVWRAHFGQAAGSGSGASANAAVPEPATSVLLMYIATCWGLPRRRAV